MFAVFVKYTVGDPAKRVHTEPHMANCGNRRLIILSKTITSNFGPIDFLHGTLSRLSVSESTCHG